MYELKGSILDIIEEIKKGLYANLLVQEPKSDYEVSNKLYVDDADESPVFYEDRAVSWEGEVVQWQT